jgi:phosphatidylglycerol:prolipoprotein diacylglycerol transferase
LSFSFFFEDKRLGKLPPKMNDSAHFRFKSLQNRQILESIYYASCYLLVAAILRENSGISLLMSFLWIRIESVYPILGRYGPFFLYSYTILLAIGLVIGVAITAWLVQDDKRPYWLDSFLCSLFGSLVGGRVGFVVAQWGYYTERPSEIANFGQGGLSYYGALLGSLLGLALWCWRKKQPFAPTIALFTPALAIIHLFGWLACLLEGCGFGATAVLTNNPLTHWLTADLPDTFGVYDLRYQTQLVGMVLSLVVFLLVMRWGGKRPSVSHFYFVLCAFSLIQFLISLWRGDTVPLINNIRSDTFLSLIFALLSFILLQYSTKQNRDMNT